MNRLILATAALATLTYPAAAQPIATDNELHAAYCIGALRDQVDMSSISGRPFDKMFERFQAYLGSTRIFDDPFRSTAAAGATIAVNRGVADGYECQAHVNECTAHYRDGSPGSSSEKYAQMSRCMNMVPACKRTYACWPPDNMPF